MGAPDRAARRAEGAPDSAFEAWLAERVNFAATSLLGLTLRPTFNAGWDAAVAARPAPAAAPREGYLTALDRIEAWWRNIEGATSLPYWGWQDDLMIVLRLAREAARGEGES